MYENEAAQVRLGMEFLQAMTEEEDYLLNPTFDRCLELIRMRLCSLQRILDQERKLKEIQADVNRTHLKSAR